MNIGNGVRINNYQRPVNLTEIAERGNPKTGSVGPADTSFKQMFSQELTEKLGVSFSKHASERLYSRGIEVSGEQLNRIAEAIDKAGTRGSRETLILTDDAALVVSVNNRTVITAFDREHLREGVITSIDSAVIL